MPAFKEKHIFPQQLGSRDAVPLCSSFPQSIEEYPPCRIIREPARLAHYASTLPLHVFVKAYRRLTVILLDIGARLRARFLGRNSF